MVGERYEVDDLIHVALLVLHEPLALDLARPSGDRVGLDTGLEVCEAVGAQIPLEWIILIGRAFLAAAGFLAFCHDQILL